MEFVSTLFKTPPEKLLKPCSSESIPKRKIAIPAEISLKLGLIQKPYPRAMIVSGKRMFFVIYVCFVR